MLRSGTTARKYDKDETRWGVRIGEGLAKRLCTFYMLVNQDDIH